MVKKPNSCQWRLLNKHQQTVFLRLISCLVHALEWVSCFGGRSRAFNNLLVNHFLLWCFETGKSFPSFQKNTVSPPRDFFNCLFVIPIVVIYVCGVNIK